MEEDKEYDEIMRVGRMRMHLEDLKYPEYVEGFNSPEDAENPYEFPLEINMEQIRISSIEGPLTEAQNNRLRELGDLMDATPWSKWNIGNYRDEYIPRD